MRKLMADSESDQLDKLQKAGMQITRPDLAPFRARMEPAYQRISDYAGADNVRKFREIVDTFRKS
jgi:TRAP-type C4-dicarboxylate transport system substrate-binding protein